MSKRVWTAWTLRVNARLTVRRLADGQLLFVRGQEALYGSLTPTEARRLFQKLSGYFRD